MNTNLTLLIGRILLAFIFIMAGASKFGAIAGTAGYIASKGLPAATLLAWAAAVFELVAGLMILVGFKTRLAAYALALFCLVAGLIFHFDPAVQAEMINFMKNLAIAGGFLALSVSGPGAYSLDARRG
ncbi:MAG: DoxX family protein [Salaquimonas sp.]